MGSFFSNGGLIGAEANFENSYCIVPEPSLVYVGGQAGGALGSSINQTITFSVGATIQTGDIVIVAAELSGTADKTYRIADSSSVLYTQIADLYANDTTDSNFQVGYKVMGAVPDSSFILLGGSGSSLDGYAYAVHVWRGFDTQKPIESVSLVTKTTLNTGIPSFSQITPRLPNSQIIVISGTAHTGGQDTFSSTELSNFLSAGAPNDDNDATIGIGSYISRGTAFTPQNWTFSQTDATSYSNNSVCFELNPQLTLKSFQKSGIWSLGSSYLSAKQ